MTPTAAAVRARLRALGDDAHAALAQRYFRTGPGGYGEGDRFLGIRVPELRRLTRECRTLPLGETDKLLTSPFHEARLLALLLLVAAYERGDDLQRARIYQLYLRRTARINNWDLVDLSAPRIVGCHLERRSRAPLDRLARSKDVWERRIAVLATFWFLRLGEVEPSMRLATALLADPHDLIHKATGWMLREAAKVDRAAAEAFLRAHQRTMPRTMLRYAIERFPESLRKRYLAGNA